MTANGWLGPPVLTIAEEQAITGTHRIAAARQTGTEIMTLDLSDVTEESTMEIGARVYEATDLWHTGITIGRVGFALYLTPEQVTEYGLDTDDIAGILTAITGSRPHPRARRAAS